MQQTLESDTCTLSALPPSSMDGLEERRHPFYRMMERISISMFEFKDARMESRWNYGRRSLTYMSLANAIY